MSKTAEMSQTATETSVEARNISKVYCDGDRRLEILTGVSLSVRKGETVVVLGPSGSGKSTLLNILAGLDVPNAGTVTLEGTELTALDDDGRARFRNKHLGFVFQFYHLLPEFTALENVMLPVMIPGSEAPADGGRGKAVSLLEKVGLKERLGHFPGELSGGEQQRVAIARALMNEPDILFCDEPTGNLDRKTGEEIIRLLRQFAGKDKAVVIVTHDAAIAKDATKVWNIVKGDWE